MLAKQAATVDEISGGRLVLGLGAGWNETEFAAFGFPFDHRIGRFAEAFTIIRTLLREGAIDFEGEFFTARDCELVPRPRPGGPPLLVGSTGPRMLEITAPHVDAWNAWFNAFGNRPAGIAALRAQVDAAALAAGRDPGAIERTVAVQVRLPGGRGRVQGETAHDAIPPVEGSPAEIATLLRAFAAEGIAHVQLVVDPITLASLDALAPGPGGPGPGLSPDFRDQDRPVAGSCDPAGAARRIGLWASTARCTCGPAGAALAARQRPRPVTCAAH